MHRRSPRTKRCWPGCAAASSGREQPLGDDFAAYLSSAGAHVSRAPDLDPAAAEAVPDAAEVWLLLPSEAGRSAGFGRRHRRRAGTVASPSAGASGASALRSPRAVVTLDVDTLPRRTLLRAVALAAGRIDRATADDAAQTAPEPLAVEGAPPRREALRQGRLILVAEDNETNRIVISRQLGLLGLAADVVTNGLEALESWRTGDYALLLTDLHMPKMDGFALAAAIRAEEGAGRRAPILALTANVLRDDELPGGGTHFDGYLVKPLLLAQLRSAIEAVLGPAAGPASQPEMAAAERNVVSLPADLRFLRSLVGDDPDVIDEVTESFIESSHPCRCRNRSLRARRLAAPGRGGRTQASGRRPVGRRAAPGRALFRVRADGRAVQVT